MRAPKMIHRQSWITAVILLSVMRTVNVQFAMPMPMYQPPPPLVMMAPPPPPVHVPVGVPFPVPIPVLVTRKPTTTTTTTTTTKAPDEGDGGDTKFAVAFPLPFGFPMPFAMPQVPLPKFCADKARPKQCPPCPPCVCAPSCTPAFYSFCSPCHQKCRCKSNGDTPRPESPRPPPPVPMLPAPMPMPYPMAPAPGPIFIFPLPPAMPVRRPPRRVPIESRSTEVSGSSSETETDSYSDGRRRRRRKHKTKRTFRNHRRNARISETSDDMATVEHETKLVKPMLSYINKHGEVKFEKKISEDDAVHLMETDGSKSFENIRNSRRSSNLGKDSVKPVLSFISKQGDVKFEKKISEDEAARLMETDRSKSYENIQKSFRASNSGKDSKNPMISYISKQGKLKFETKISQDGAAHLETDKSSSVEKIGKSFRSAGKDSRTVIFRPPPNKKITNLTVSFDVVS